MMHILYSTIWLGIDFFLLHHLVRETYIRVE